MLTQIVAVTVLIIARPCALELATPTSLTVGMGKGAEGGILFRGGDALQAARRVDTIVPDKTGTITWCKPALTDVIAGPAFTEADGPASAASVERSSEHPLAQAIVEGATARDTTVVEPERFEAVPGHGVEAAVGGRAVLLGNRKLMTDRGVDRRTLDERLGAWRPTARRRCTSRSTVAPLSPLLASVAMAFSSVTVVTNANRLRRWTSREAAS